MNGPPFRRSIHGLCIQEADRKMFVSKLSGKQNRLKLICIVYIKLNIKDNNMMV